MDRVPGVREVVNFGETLDSPSGLSETDVSL
jgi:hypothetical protein